MEVTIHYPEQVKVGWRYSQVEIYKNGKPFTSSKKNKQLVLELKEGDTLLAKIGLIKSNVINIHSSVRCYKIKISDFLRYDSITFFLVIVLNAIITSSLPWELSVLFTYFGTFVLLCFMYAFYLVKGNHLKIIPYKD